MSYKLHVAPLLFLSLGTTHTAVANPDLSSRYTARVMTLVNQYRESHHLPGLVVDQRLTGLAQEHSQKMANKRLLSHDGFDERFNRANRELCVENVGTNFPNAAALVEGWRRSAGHNRNLLDGEVRSVGVSVYQGYATFFACT